MVWVKQKTGNWYLFIAAYARIFSIKDINCLAIKRNGVFIEYSLTNLIFSIIWAMHIIQSSIGIVMRKLMVLLVE